MRPFLGQIFNWNRQNVSIDLDRDTLLSAYETMSDLAVIISEEVGSPLNCPSIIAFIPRSVAAKAKLSAGQTVAGKAENINGLLTVSDIKSCMDPYIASTFKISGVFENVISLQPRRSSINPPKFSM